MPIALLLLAAAAAMLVAGGSKPALPADGGGRAPAPPPPPRRGFNLRLTPNQAQGLGGVPTSSPAAMQAYAAASDVIAGHYSFILANIPEDGTIGMADWRHAVSQIQDAVNKLPFPAQDLVASLLQSYTSAAYSTAFSRGDCLSALNTWHQMLDKDFGVASVDIGVPQVSGSAPSAGQQALDALKKLV